MRTILIATDHSLVAANAVDYAANLARDTQSELILFTVFKLSVHAKNALTSSTTIQNFKKNSEDQLVALKNKLEDQYGIPVTWVLGNDDTIESLRDCIHDNPVDLAVMGIENNLTDYKLFGNTTTDAIKLMQFPILVVPDNVHYQPIKKVMFACDSTYLDPVHGLDRLKEIIHWIQADLSVFHVLADDTVEAKNKFEQEMKGLLTDIGHTYSYVAHPRIGEGIEIGIKQNSADLLVMIPHVLGFFESLFKGSNTSYVAVRTKVPLLVIPNQRIN